MTAHSYKDKNEYDKYQNSMFRISQKNDKHRNRRLRTALRIPKKMIHLRLSKALNDQEAYYQKATDLNELLGRKVSTFK